MPTVDFQPLKSMLADATLMQGDTVVASGAAVVRYREPGRFSPGEWTVTMERASLIAPIDNKQPVSIKARSEKDPKIVLSGRVFMMELSAAVDDTVRMELLGSGILSIDPIAA